MLNAGTVVAEMRLDAKKFKQGVGEAKTSLRDLKNEESGMSSTMTKMSGGMTKAGKSMSKSVTLPLLGIGAAAVKVTADFESAMSEVQAIAGITDKSSKAFTDLEANAKQLGATTAFSASESAEGMKYLAMAGMETDEIIAAMPGLLDLAAASGTDLGTTADIVSDSLSAFGLEAKDSGHLADVMAVASSKANTNVEMLGESFKYSAPIAKAFGMSAEETTTALSMMANSGIKAGQAGTTLRSALTNLAKPSEDAIYWMNEMDLSTVDAQGNMLGFNEIMGQVREGFKGMTQEQQLQASTALFGKQAMSGMTAVLETSTEDFDAFTEQLVDANGASKEMAETRLENLSGQLTLLKSGVAGAAISIGETLVPMIKTVVEKIQEWTAKFNELSPEMKEVVVKIGLVLAVMGPLLLIVGKIIAVVQVLTALAPLLGTAFTIMTGPIGLVIAAIAAVIAIGVLLWKNWDEIKVFAQQLWDKIKEIFSGIVESISTAFNDMVTNIVNFGIEFKEAGRLLFTAFWNKIKEIFGWIVESISTAFSTLVTSIVNFGVEFKEAGRALFTALWEKIKEIFGWIIESISTYFSTMVTNILGFGQGFKDAGTEIFNRLWDGIKGVWNKLSSWVREKVKWLKEKLTFWKKTEQKMNKSSVKTYSSSSSIADPYKNQSEHYAQGTTNARKGWNWVGEDGPELKKFEGGETVLPANLSRAITSAKGAVSGSSAISNIFGSVNSALSKLSSGATNLKIEIKEMSVRNDGDIKLVADEIMRKVDAKLSGSTQAVMNQVRKEARL